MPNNPKRREVLKYAGAAGVAMFGFNWLGSQAASAATGSATRSADAATQRGPLDTIVFGDAVSEAAHGLVPTLTTVVTSGGLGQSARILNPTSPVSYWGGTLAFTLACKPTGTTYVTVKLWGDEHDDTSTQEASGSHSWRLQLFCEGLQVGYEDQGAVDSLDILDTAPRTPGRFFYHTLPLPEKLTAGRTQVNLEIRAMGRIWSYGQNQAQLYYNMTTDSRGIYRLYSHTDPYFTPADGDVQGPEPVPGTRTTPGPEALTAVRQRVLNDQQYFLTDATPSTLDGWAMQSLAEGYLWSGSPAYQQEQALDRVLAAIDGRYYAWQSNATVLTASDQQWQGFGRVGLVLALLWDKLGTRLEQPVTGSPFRLANPGFEDGGGKPTYWAVPGWGNTNATWSRDTTVARHGGASLKLSVGASGGFITAYSTPRTQVTAGLTYTYGAWVKTEGTSGQGAYVDPLFFDASGKLVGSDHKVFSTTGTHDWEYVSLPFTTPATATQVELHLRLSNAGTAWFDDVTFGTPYEFANPGFENGGATPAFWAVPGWGDTNASWSRDATVSRTDGASLKLSVGPTLCINTSYTTPRLQVSAGTYTYGAWVRTEGTSGEGAYVDPLFYDASGNLVGSDHKVYSTTGTHDWEYVSASLDTPANATSVELHLRLSNAGTAWFDDVTLAAPANAATDAPPVRRNAYIDMLRSSRDYWRQHYPHYSNQTQICAIGIYQANRGLGLLDPSLALPEAQIRSYLYEAIGLTPYQGPEDADGNPTWPIGHGYYQVTAKGLTRELGYVGSYGEVTDWMIMMYESVTRGYGAQQAPELRDQMIKMVKARGWFHPIDVDGDYCRIARVETVVGWRNEAYPGIANYAQRTVWDSHPLQAAVVFQDPDLIGWTQEMFNDGQFYSQLDLLINHTWTRVGLNALRLVARDWDAYQALPSSPSRLPTAWSAADFVVADEENGVIAVKHGRELLYASLYWRARQGVNNYARIHHLTPVDQRSATIREQSAGNTGNTFTVQDWVLWDYAINDPSAGGIPPGGFPPPGPALRQALAGDVLPIAPIPADVPDPTLGVHFTGVEEVLVGKAPFYLCVYGPYLIAMNTSTDKTFSVPPRPAFGPARNLTDHNRIVLPLQRLTVAPRNTVVLRRI